MAEEGEERGTVIFMIAQPLTGNQNLLYVVEVREDIHMSEAVDSHHREVFLALTQVVEWVGKHNTICCHSIDYTCAEMCGITIMLSCLIM